MLRFLVAGGFAGIRTDEQLGDDAEDGLHSRDFDWEDGEIHIRPEVIKNTAHRGGMRERYIKMIPAFLRWMPRDFTGPMLPVTDRQFRLIRKKHRERVAKLMARLNRFGGFQFDLEKWKDWPDNCLRHTYASAMLAATKNAALVSEEMGHTNPRTLKKEYARAMKERAARSYLDL